jgi:hypothetical protein
VRNPAIRNLESFNYGCVLFSRDGKTTPPYFLFMMIIVYVFLGVAGAVMAESKNPRNPSISMSDLLLTLTPEPTALPTTVAPLSDQEFAVSMNDLSVLLEAIYSKTNEINDSICQGNMTESDKELIQLADLISEANTILTQVKLPYTFSLWDIYHQIQTDQTCGTGDKASQMANEAIQTFHTAAQFVNYEEEHILCPCYDVATDTYRNTGHFYAGACKCVNY